MVEIGYALSSEEHEPNDLVENAARAEEAGFEYGLISDHYHPWTDTQGHSPFVWSVIGGIAEATDEFTLGTGVTCPTTRTHPAIIAQAAATAGAMMPGRFFVGVGTGENLNEHVLGDHRPPHHVRLSKLEEAIEVIRTLWQAGYQNHHGDHYTVENARIYTLPDDLPPIVMSADGETSGRAAADLADGIVSTAPRDGVVETYTENTDNPGPRYGQMTVCWAETIEESIGRVEST